MTRFRTPPGQDPIRVALLTGHATFIGHDWQELEERYHREALKLGAQTEAAENRVVSLPPAVDNSETAAIRGALIQMLNEAEPEHFNAAGQPNLKTVRELAGFNANRDTIHKIFAALRAEAATSPAGEALSP